jgi:hypothetical protein
MFSVEAGEPPLGLEGTGDDNTLACGTTIWRFFALYLLSRSEEFTYKSVASLK